MRRLRFIALVTVGMLAGCAKSDLTDEHLAELHKQSEQLAQILALEPAPTTDAVVVQLIFGAEADLDLYVTDPLLETVYFARHESRTGGKIGKDVRCDVDGSKGAQPRVEEVRFAEHWPGRYRVGVDFPRRCDDERAPAPAAYAVTAYANGEIYRARGIVDLELFEVVVLDFDVLDEDSSS